jgi:hypothetical protein
MLPLSPTDFTPAKTPEYHWSPANQRAFLEALSTTGNVSESAKAVSMSGQAAYAFCNRTAGRIFRLGWDAAVLVARRRVEGELLERALVGQEEIYERDPDTGCVRRTRIHNGTTMAMLARLDRMASRTSDVPADTVMAQIVAQDFERFLDLVEAGGGGAEAMLFLKARDGALVPMAGFDAAEFAKHYQLSRNSADIDDDDMEEEPPAVDEPDLTPEEAAAKMSVWFCEYAQDWRTNFPPPEGFLAAEDGEFGENGYERALDDDEELYYRDQLAAEVAPLRAAGEAARRVWFGLPEASDDFAQRRRDAEEEGCDESALPSTTTLCHPRERASDWTSAGGPSIVRGTMQPDADPWPKVALENEPRDELQVQTMDPRLRGDDSSGGEVSADEVDCDIEHMSIENPLRPPPDDPTIRVIHCAPQINYAARGMIPPDIARELGISVPYGDGR